LKEATFEQTLASLALMIDEVTASEDTQLQGIVMVGDCKGLTFSHVKSISVAKIQGMFSIIQVCNEKFHLESEFSRIT